MPYIADEQLDEIREKIDIFQLVSELIPLKKAGRNYKGLCPFHSEKTPSLIVSPEKQIFHCFGCGAGGNIFRFIMMYEGLDFVEAVSLLAEQAGVALRFAKGDQQGVSLRGKKMLVRANRLAAEYYFNQLHAKEGKDATDYLHERAVTSEISRQYLLGYASAFGGGLLRHFELKKVPLAVAEQAGLIRRGSDGTYYDFFRDRLIFPIRNAQGDFIGFGGRILSSSDQGQAKYLNTSDTPVYHKGKEIYGHYEARSAIREKQRVFLVEGYLDVLALVQYGFQEVVAPLGTAVTRDQIRRLQRQADEIIVVFDGDSAGLKAAWRALEIVSAEKIQTRILILPPGDDPDTYLHREGATSFQERALAAPGILDYFIDMVAARAKPDNLGRLEALKQLVPLLGILRNGAERSIYINRISQKLSIATDTISKELSNMHKNTRNFPRIEVDKHAAKRQGGGARPFERDLFCALVLGQEQGLIEEVVALDWHHPTLRARWPQLKDLLVQSSSAAEILGMLENDDLSQELSGVLVSHEQGTGELEELVLSCSALLKRRHREKKQETLTQQIREAEAAHDIKKMEDLLMEKDRLIKGMDQAHVR